MELILYTTLGCHLCDKAKEVIWPLLDRYPYRLREVDIADDESLVERFGVRIPVVKRQDLPEDLGWPFDSAQLEAYLAQ